MKKTFAAAAILSIFCALAFCKGNANERPPVDVYDDGTEEAQKQKDDIEKKKKAAEEKGQKVTKIKWNTKKNRLAAMQGDPYNKKKMIGKRGFGERLLNINKFTKIEPCTAYLRLTIGGLVLRKGHLIYREGTDVAGFEMYYDSSAYALQFATADRAAVIDAINRYFNDFDEKRLDRKANFKKTRAVYGFCNSYEDFGIISGMMTNFSKPKVYLGYTFVKHTPYFTINVRPAKNLAYEGDQSEEAMLKGTTIEQTYFFTKAQAKKLAAFLDDSNISSMQDETTEDEGVSETDVYEAPDGTESQQEAPAAPQPAQESKPASEASEKSEPSAE